MKIGSLFAGIGGFDLAAQWVGWETAWFSEIDPYASAVLKKHWPTVPNLGDITQIGTPPKVDLLCGGFPCQDISVAGKAAGIAGSRSGLWKQMLRIIDATRPSLVLAENVAALRSRGLLVVLNDLAEIGYDAEWHCIPASSLGAAHQRDRIWILAYPSGEGLSAGREVPFCSESIFSVPSRSGVSLAVARPGQAQWAWEKPRLVESPMGSTTDGLSRQLVRARNRGSLQTLGNAIVPEVAEVILHAIGLEELMGAAA